MSGFAMLLAAVLAAEAPVPGTITIEPAAGTLGPEEREVFTEAVANALADANFTPIPAPGKGRYVAKVTVTRTPRGVVAAKAPKGGATANVGNWGGGVNVALGSNAKQISGLMATELRVEIVGRDRQATVWSGRAITIQVQGARADMPAAVAPKLATAVIGHFPVQSDEAAAIP